MNFCFLSAKVTIESDIEMKSSTDINNEIVFLFFAIIFLLLNILLCVTEHIFIWIEPIHFRNLGEMKNVSLYDTLVLTARICVAVSDRFCCLGTIRCRCTHIFTSTVIMENNMRLIVRAFRCHLRQFLHCMRFAIRWESLRQLSSDKNLDSQIVSHFIFRHLSSHFSFSLSLVIYSFLVAVHYFNCYNAAAVN